MTQTILLTIPEVQYQITISKVVPSAPGDTYNELTPFAPPDGHLFDTADVVTNDEDDVTFQVISNSEFQDTEEVSQ